MAETDIIKILKKERSTLDPVDQKEVGLDDLSSLEDEEVCDFKQES